MKKSSVWNELTPLHKWVLGILVFGDICAIFCFLLFYGPWSGFRDWAITSAMHTTEHSYFAYTFYTQEQIDEAMARNRTVETEEHTDTALIQFTKHDPSQGYASEYEKLILEHEESQDYKILEFKEDGLEGFMTVIYDPTRLHMGMAKRSDGNKLTAMAEIYQASIVFNGGTFGRNWNTHVIIPNSSLIQNGKILYDSGEENNLIGMTKEGVLCLAKTTAEGAISLGMDWALCFTPFLIVNGKPTEMVGDGGYGTAPRTAIGQRADGIVIVLTIDGYVAGNNGATVLQLQKIFARYMCVNAANLDGGGSTELVVDGVIRNKPMGGGFAEEGERWVYNCIYFK